MRIEKSSRQPAFTLMAVIIMIAATLSLTSCDPDDSPYYDPLVGTWQLTGVPMSYVNEFDFYGDGTGYYYAYDDYGNWTYWPMTYDVYGSRLTIYLSTGQVWNYQWAIRGTTLMLNDLQVGGNTLYYEYVY